jgi:hypothetical protein
MRDERGFIRRIGSHGTLYEILFSSWITSEATRVSKSKVPRTKEADGLTVSSR